MEQKFVIPVCDDMQAAKLALALDIRRLAEILAAYDAWSETYGENEKFFRDIAFNDLLDIIGRMKKISGGLRFEDPELQRTHDIIPERRFKLKHHGFEGKTNEDLRREAALDLQYINFISSKILHADEYSVYDHFAQDKYAWLLLIMAGDLVCRIYRSSPIPALVQE